MKKRMKKLIKKYETRIEMEREVLEETILTCDNIKEARGVLECIEIYQEIIRDLKSLLKEQKKRSK